jgi:hypothetical protein
MKISIEQATTAIEAASFVACGTHECIHGVQSIVVRLAFESDVPPSQRRAGPTGDPVQPVVARVDLFHGTFNLQVWDRGWKPFCVDIPTFAGASLQRELRDALCTLAKAKS